MKFDFDHPAPTDALSPEEYWAFCEEMMRRNPLLRPETCMDTHDDERWMEAPFSLFKTPASVSGKPLAHPDDGSS